jgi:hypothetical protein
MLDTNTKVFELFGTPGKYSQGLGHTELWHAAHWTYSTVDLKRRIEEILLVNSIPQVVGPLTEYAGARNRRGVLK